jgi:hypothetical protein
VLLLLLLFSSFSHCCLFVSLFFTSAVFRFGSVDYHTTIIVGLLFALLFQLISLPKKKKRRDTQRGESISCVGLGTGQENKPLRTIIIITIYLHAAIRTFLVG